MRYAGSSPPCHCGMFNRSVVKVNANLTLSRLEEKAMNLGCAADKSHAHVFVLSAAAAFQDRKSTRRTPVTNAHLVCRLMLEKKTTIYSTATSSARLHTMITPLKIKTLS